MSKHKIEGLISKEGLALNLKEMNNEDTVILEVSVENMKELINYDDIKKSHSKHFKSEEK